MVDFTPFRGVYGGKSWLLFGGSGVVHPVRAPAVCRLAGGAANPMVYRSGAHLFLASEFYAQPAGGVPLPGVVGADAVEILCAVRLPDAGKRRSGGAGVRLAAAEPDGGEIPDGYGAVLCQLPDPAAVCL